MTTENERRFLAAVRDSDYHDGNDPVGNPVWMNCIGGWEAQAKAGTVSSLVAKGFIRTQGDGVDGLVTLTREGAEALASGFGEPCEGRR